jgi:4-hydroxybenzoyl-CoA reductase subunit alpha
MSGHAVKMAAEDAKRKVLEALSEQLKVPVEDMDIAGGVVVFKKDKPDFSRLRTMYIKEHRGWEDQPSGAELTFREAARVAFITRGVIIGNGAYKPGELGGKYKGAAVGTSPAYGCSAQVVEVTVDEETGKVTMMP